MFEYVWPHLDPDKRWPNWRWCRVRCAAEEAQRAAVREHLNADSDEVARAFRDDVARYSDMMSPGVRCLAGG
jgi:hypothetical protein